MVRLIHVVGGEAVCGDREPVLLLVRVDSESVHVVTSDVVVDVFVGFLGSLDFLLDHLLVFVHHLRGLI